MAALEGRWESGGAPLLILEGLQGLSGRAQLSFKSPPPAPLIGKSPSLALHQAGHEPCPARQPWVSTDPLPSLCEDVEQPERRRDHGHRACPMACPCPYGFPTVGAGRRDPRHGLCPCAGSSIAPRATCSLSPGEGGPQEPTLPAQGSARQGAAAMPAPHSTQPRGQPSGCQTWEVKDPRDSPWGCMAGGVGGSGGDRRGPDPCSHPRDPQFEGWTLIPATRDPAQGLDPHPCPHVV